MCGNSPNCANITSTLPRPILLIATRAYKDIPTLITNHIELLPIAHTLKNITHLIFTSRYAIDSIVQSSMPNSPFYNPALAQWYKIPSLVISPKSANVLKQHGANIIYIGYDGHGDKFANEIVPLLHKSTPLYLRARKISSHLPNILSQAFIPLQEVIAYQNHPLTLPKSSKPLPGSILIFSAPSVYKSFYQNFGWDNSYTAIAIGQSTYKAFEKGIDSYISQQTSIESCIALARQLSYT